MAKLEAGEKYLSVKIVGNSEFIPAFPNKDKKTHTEPDYKGDGIAVWVRVKKAEAPKEEVVRNEA